jgi:hypothetical protein
MSWGWRCIHGGSPRRGESAWLGHSLLPFQLLGLARHLNQAPAAAVLLSLMFAPGCTLRWWGRAPRRSGRQPRQGPWCCCTGATRRPARAGPRPWQCWGWLFHQHSALALPAAEQALLEQAQAAQLGLVLLEGEITSAAMGTWMARCPLALLAYDPERYRQRSSGPARPYAAQLLRPAGAGRGFRGLVCAAAWQPGLKRKPGRPCWNPVQAAQRDQRAGVGDDDCSHCSRVSRSALVSAAVRRIAPATAHLTLTACMPQWAYGNRKRDAQLN